MSWPSKDSISNNLLEGCVACIAMVCWLPHFQLWAFRKLVLLALTTPHKRKRSRKLLSVSTRKQAKLPRESSTS
eukprot:6455413-Amphidinium_carterae.6